MTVPDQARRDFTSGLSPADFTWICDFLYARTGIVLKDGKQALVVGRLGRRLAHHQLASYRDYFRLLADPGGDEAGIAVDLLTTNETYFFREPEHFDFLRELLAGRAPGGPAVRVWSAASSSGEEAYSLAMTLAQSLRKTDWEVFGTDISSRVVERARTGLYPLDAAAKIPKSLLREYCLRGKGDFEGYLAVHPTLTSKVTFAEMNLLQPRVDLGRFDVIFLRNVMIYFDLETKRGLVSRMIPLLKPGGHLMISHSETLNGIQDGFTLVSPSVYRVNGP